MQGQTYQIKIGLLSSMLPDEFWGYNLRYAVMNPEFFSSMGIRLDGKKEQFAVAGHSFTQYIQPGYERRCISADAGIDSFVWITKP